MVKRRNITGIAALLAAIAYVAMPFDFDRIGWYGYIDDFLVFMAGYTFFMACRNRTIRLRRLLSLIAGCFFIAGMLSLIILTILS